MSSSPFGELGGSTPRLATTTGGRDAGVAITAGCPLWQHDASCATNGGRRCRIAFVFVIVGFADRTSEMHRFAETGSTCQSDIEGD
jgi:hypothetical protein